MALRQHLAKLSPSSAILEPFTPYFSAHSSILACVSFLALRFAWMAPYVDYDHASELLEW